MSDQEYDIKVDDLILFFRRAENGEEKILNRLISHDIYTAGELKIPDEEVLPAWKDAVLSEPGIDGHPDQHYHVANLARLIMPAEALGQQTPSTATLPPVTWSPTLANEDLVVFPPEGTQSCFRVPREVYEACPELPASDIPDLEFMAGEEGVVLANVPKVTPQGCSCILLSLANLRSGMLSLNSIRSGMASLAKRSSEMASLAELSSEMPRKREVESPNKTDHAKVMQLAFARGRSLSKR